MTYPRIGSIQVSHSGDALVYVWPNESSSTRTFTGVELFTSDCSCMWLRNGFEAENLFKRAALRKYRGQLRASRINAKAASHEA